MMNYMINYRIFIIKIGKNIPHFLRQFVKFLTTNENIDHKKAVEFFRNWAESNDKKYVDWIACYKNACRTWLQDKIPPPSKSTKVNRISLD